MRHSVSKNFRDFCLDKYPALRESKPLRSLFRCLCFSTFVDDDTQQLVIPFQFLHKEVAPEERERDFNAAALLEEMRKEVPLRTV